MSKNVLNTSNTKKSNLEEEDDCLEQITNNRFHPVEEFSRLANCVCKIHKDGGSGTGFFLKIKNNEKEFKLLITNEHIIREEMVKNNSKITIIIHYVQKRTIELNRNKRIIECFPKSENEDITIVQILEDDNIPETSYLELDDNFYTKIEKEDFYEGKIVYLFHFPYSGEQCWSVGTVIGASKDNLSFSHDASTANGSSGSPVIYNGSLKVIGVHGERDKNNGKNIGVLLGKIINKFKQRIDGYLGSYNRRGSQECAYGYNPEYNKGSPYFKEDTDQIFYNYAQGNESADLYKRGESEGYDYYYDQRHEDSALFNRASTKKILFDYGSKYDRDDSPGKGRNNLDIGLLTEEGGSIDTLTNKNKNKEFEDSKILKTDCPSEIECEGKNVIECEYYVKDYKKIQYETKLFDNKVFKGFNKNNTEIYIDGVKVDFTSTYKFGRRNAYHKVKYIISDELTDISSMFKYCYSLSKVDFSKFSTKKVTSMKDMFNLCYSLKYIDLSSFNTENVINIASMFFGCSSLTYIDLSSFNVNKVTNMEKIFVDCKSLKEIDLSNCNAFSISKLKKELPKRKIKIIYPDNMSVK